MPYVPKNDRPALDRVAKKLAEEIAKTAAPYKYDGAFAGEMNYALTRLMCHLPRALMKYCGFKDELRYWMMPLMYGVLNDVALEHKFRVNTAYEAEQIRKNGDCYDTPFVTQLIEVVDDAAHGNKKRGWVHVMKAQEER